MDALKKFMAKTYPMLIEPGQESGYIITYPDLPGIIASSEDQEDAIQAAEELREEFFLEYQRRGWTIPEPGELDSCSGTLTVRIPVSLHRRLKMTAKREKTTMNQLASYLLTSGLERSEVKESRRR